MLIIEQSSITQPPLQVSSKESLHQKQYGGTTASQINQLNNDVVTQGLDKECIQDSFYNSTILKVSDVENQVFLQESLSTIENNPVVLFELESFGTFQVLPLELIDKIFKNLSIRQLMLAQRVSKAFYFHINSSDTLQRKIAYELTKRYLYPLGIQVGNNEKKFSILLEQRSLERLVTLAAKGYKEFSPEELYEKIENSSFSNFTYEQCIYLCFEKMISKLRGLCIVNAESEHLQTILNFITEYSGNISLNRLIIASSKINTIASQLLFALHQRLTQEERILSTTLYSVDLESEAMNTLRNSIVKHNTQQEEKPLKLDEIGLNFTIHTLKNKPSYIKTFSFEDFTLLPIPVQTDILNNLCFCLKYTAPYQKPDSYLLDQARDFLKRDPLHFAVTTSIKYVLNDRLRSG